MSVLNGDFQQTITALLRPAKSRSQCPLTIETAGVCEDEDFKAQGR